MRRLLVLLLLVLSLGLLFVDDHALFASLTETAPGLDGRMDAQSSSNDFRLNVPLITPDEAGFPQFPREDENTLEVAHNGDLQRSWYAASADWLFVHVNTEDDTVLRNEAVRQNRRDGFEITLYETPELRCQIIFTADGEVFPSQFCGGLGVVLFFDVSSTLEGYDMDIILSSDGLGFLDGFNEGEQFRIAIAFNDQDTPGEAGEQFTWPAGIRFDQVLSYGFAELVAADEGNGVVRLPVGAVCIPARILVTDGSFQEVTVDWMEGEALQVISAPGDSFSPQVNAVLPVLLEKGEEYRIWAHFLGRDVNHDAFYVGLGDPNSTQSRYKDIMGRVKTNEVWGSELWARSEEKDTYTADTTGLEVLVLGAAETEVIIGEILLLPVEVTGIPQGHCGELELVAQ